MEVKRRLILRHTSGRFLSWSPDNFPLTHRLSEARRFLNAEEISVFLQASAYAPENPEDYEIVTLKITFELEESEHDDTQSGTEEGETSPRDQRS